MSKQTVLVSGGELEEDFALPILESEETELIIGVDKGCEFLYAHSIRPDYIIGDFDSASSKVVKYFKETLDVPAKELEKNKDLSDTECALKFALKLNRRRMIILGATGSRLDHVWANVQSLTAALDRGADVTIMDRHNRIRLLDRDFTLKKDEAFGRNFSVFPLGETIDGFGISGAKYPLKGHTLSPFDSLCVSNEFAEDEVRISVPYGIVILMETRE